MYSPTMKQIEYVERMTSALRINFPTSSKEFTKKTYSDWIAAHIDDYKDLQDSAIYDEDYLYEYGCENDVWCEYY